MSDNSTLDELIAATVEARELIREAHEAVKDLRQATRDAKREANEIWEDMRGNFQKDVRDLLKSHIAEIKEITTSDVKNMVETQKNLSVALFQGTESSIRYMEQIARQIVLELTERRGDPNELADWAEDALRQAREMLDAGIDVMDLETGRVRKATKAEMGQFRSAAPNGGIPPAFQRKAAASG